MIFFFFFFFEGKNKPLLLKLTTNALTVSVICKCIYKTVYIALCVYIHASYMHHICIYNVYVYIFVVISPIFYDLGGLV